MSELKKEIKMSDHFAGELSLNGDWIEDSDFHYATTSCASEVDGIDFGEAICHAVNNHDYLVSQLEQVTKERDELKAALIEISKMGTMTGKARKQATDKALAKLNQ